MRRDINWVANGAPPSAHHLSAEARLAILETELRHVSHAVKDVADAVEKIEHALTTAAGVKLALITIGAGLAFAASQLWHFLDFRGLK